MKIAKTQTENSISISSATQTDEPDEDNNYIYIVIAIIAVSLLFLWKISASREKTEPPAKLRYGKSNMFADLPNQEQIVFEPPTPLAPPAQQIHPEPIVPEPTPVTIAKKTLNVYDPATFY
jgi:hypothetical protein